MYSTVPFCSRLISVSVISVSKQPRMQIFLVRSIPPFDCTWTRGLRGMMEGYLEEKKLIFHLEI